MSSADRDPLVDELVVRRVARLAERERRRERRRFALVRLDARVELEAAIAAHEPAPLPLDVGDWLVLLVTLSLVDSSGVELTIDELREQLAYQLSLLDLDEDPAGRLALLELTDATLERAVELVRRERDDFDDAA